jgi:sialic acid synthase SpsE
VAGADLPAGHRLIFSDLTWIRPAGGLAPGDEDQLIGKVLKRTVRFGDQLRASDVE